MDIKDIMREKNFCEIISERNDFILRLFSENQQLRKTIEDMNKAKTEKKDEPN